MGDGARQARRTAAVEAARTARSVTLILLAGVLLWEGYKALGQALLAVWPSFPLPVRPDDRSMPHVWDVVGTLFVPARRGGEDVLLVILLDAALFTWRTALVGFVGGTLFGLAVAVLLVRSRLAERSLLPYVIGSQMVPVLAIAPIVVIWGGRAGLPTWVPVAFVSGYLAFYPVTIGAVRGLRSPAATATELMRSYAAPPRTVLLRLQLPASLPYLFPALRIAATASIIGAIVGELPAGRSDGLGRAILGFASSFSAAPQRLFASVLVSALLGVVFVGLVALLERLVVPAPLRHRDPVGTTGPTASGTAPGTGRVTAPPAPVGVLAARGGS